MGLRLLISIVIFQSLLIASEGDLDISFGDNGKVITGAENRTSAESYSIAIQDDGKIITAGNWKGYDCDPVVMRQKSDGSFDNSFGVEGKIAYVSAGSDQYIRDVEILDNGNIIAVGYSKFGSGDYDIYILGLEPNGHVDTSFGNFGTVTTPVGTDNDFAFDAAIQKDGKIVVVGDIINGNNHDIVVLRYKTNGILDNTFGLAGRVIVDINNGSEDYAFSVAIQNDSKIIVAGSSLVGSDYDFIVVRYNIDGTLDNTFGTQGIVKTDIGWYSNDYAYSIAIQNDDKIVVAGKNSNGNYENFAIVRYKTDGSIDDTFGKVITDIGSPEDRILSIAIQNNGKIVAAGVFLNPYKQAFDFAVARYNVDGTLDTTFSQDGIVGTYIGSGDDYARSVAIQKDGKIVLSGSSCSAGDCKFAVVRYLGTPVNLAPIYYLLQ